jgi:hypothetical protein
MRRSMLVVAALVVVGSTLGCDRIKQAIEQRKNRNRTPATQTTPQTAAQGATDTAKTAAEPGAAAPADTTKHARPPASPPTTRAPAQTPAAPAAARPSAMAPVLHDEPYNSPDTGTVAPGMDQNQVVALWGPPAAIRHAGEYTYLHYRNGCEYTCGTDDVVILQNGQVVDAIVRWPGHGYSGQSSSPPGRKPEPTPPNS